MRPGARRTPPGSAATAHAQTAAERFAGRVHGQGARQVRAGAAGEQSRANHRSFGSEFAAALLAVSTQPTAANHRAVAARYVRLGILDQAHEHFSAAVALDPADAASWDGLARIWRDWGFPHLGLPDAYRAVYHAPDSPIVHNTLGTVLQALGRRAAARAKFEQALALDVDCRLCAEQSLLRMEARGQRVESDRRMPAGASTSSPTWSRRVTTLRSPTKQRAICPRRSRRSRRPATRHAPPTTRGCFTWLDASIERRCSLSTSRAPHDRGFVKPRQSLGKCVPSCTRTTNHDDARAGG